MLKGLRLGFYIGIAILVIDAAIPLFLAHRVTVLRNAADDAMTTYDTLHELLSAYKDAETGQRGFMLTGRQAFLAPYHDGRAVIQTLLPQLQEKLLSDPQQVGRLVRLRELDQQEAEFQQLRIAQRNDVNWYDANASEHGRQLMDQLRAAIADLSAIERERSGALLRQVTRLQHWSQVSLIAITALDLALFGLIFFIMTRAIRAEREAKNTLVELNNDLANEVALRTLTVARLQQQSNRLNQVVQMQGALAQAQLDIDGFMQDVVQRMLAVAPTTGAVIEMIEGDDMVYIAASGSIAQFVGFRLARRGSLSGLCIEKSEVMISADTSCDARVDRAACIKVGAEAMIVAPLLRAGEAVGVLKIVADKPNVFDDNAVQTLQLMAGFLGAGLGNQLQFQKNQTLLTERNATLAQLNRELQLRKEYEKTLLNQRATLHAITNAIPALIAQIDAKGYYRYCNAEYARVCNMPVENIVGRPLREFTGDARYQELKHYVDRALAGEAMMFESTVNLSAGVRHQECRLLPQFDADGNPDGFYAIAWDITERKTQEIEWQSRASIDELTGLLNRAFFTEALTLALPRHVRTGTSAAVLYLDVDRFKHINDTYGHAAGDAILKAFSNYLRNSVRQSDIIGRLGGDEFCIVLEDVKTPENAAAVAEKILVAARAPVVFENQTLVISTSIGIAFLSQPQLGSAQAIALADTALYKAKQAGRNCYALDIIDPDIAAAASS